MYNSYEPNVKATMTFIKLLKVRVNSTTINETLQNHPDWPTLLSVSDCLGKWKIPNAAAKIDVAHIDQIPTPFIACTRDRENPLAVLTRVTETEIEAYQKIIVNELFIPGQISLRTGMGNAVKQNDKSLI